MDQERGIGKNNRLPWHLPDDLKRFKALTMGHHLIMGRKTFESISRPLPGRTTIVVTRNPEYKAEGCLVAHSIQDALALAEHRGESEVFIAGGGEIFSQAVEYADQIYLTLIHTVTDSPIEFPEFSPDEWIEVESDELPAASTTSLSATFKKFKRKRSVDTSRIWS